MGLDPNEVGDVADGAARMGQRTIDPRRALALVESRLSTRMATDTPAGVRGTLDDAMRDLADPRFADALRSRYILTNDQAASVGAVQQQYGAVRWGNDTYRRDLSTFSSGLSGLDDDVVRLHALTNIAQSLNPGYAIDGDVSIGRMPVLWGRDLSVLGLPSRMLGGIDAFFNGPAGYGDDGNPLFLNPRTHSYQGQEEIAFEVAAMGMMPTPGPRGVGIVRSGLGFGTDATVDAAMATAARRSLQYNATNQELVTVVSESGKVVYQIVKGAQDRPPPEFLSALPGNRYTHNHPSGETIGFGDARTAIGGGARGVQAVGNELTYTLSIDLPPTSTSPARANAIADLNSAERAIQSSLKADPNFMALPGAQRVAAYGKAMHEYWTSLSASLPDVFKYTAVPTKR